jgi:hypothetical protein
VDLKIFLGEQAASDEQIRELFISSLKVNSTAPLAVSQ